MELDQIQLKSTFLNETDASGNADVDLVTAKSAGTSIAAGVDTHSLCWVRLLVTLI